MDDDLHHLNLFIEKLPVPHLSSSYPSASARKANVRKNGEKWANIIHESDVVLKDIVRRSDTGSSAVTPRNNSLPQAGPTCTAYVRAGPRERLFFDPKNTKACIVVCGGLCPGVNDVIHHLVMMLRVTYGVREVLGIRSGYRGFYNEDYPPVTLNPGDGIIDKCHLEGGSILGQSRGGFDLDKIVAAVQKMKVELVFIIGGDGSHRGAQLLHEKLLEIQYPCSVAGIPKTIDNDLPLIDRSFGFRSAVEEALKAIRCVKTEAACAPNGVGIVKLMGRHSGFIAAHATLANGSDVDLCLIPELPIDVTENSKTSCLKHLERCIETKKHAVVVVAEGAGEDLLLGEMKEEGRHQTNAEGKQPKLPPIGSWIKQKIINHFSAKGIDLTVKYIDPSYMIRSVPANAADSYYAMMLAQNAVHAALAGFSGFSVGLCNNRMVLLPIKRLVEFAPRGINPIGRTVERIYSTTRQPRVSSE
eukprot:g4109.t1